MNLQRPIRRLTLHAGLALCALAPMVAQAQRIQFPSIAQSGDFAGQPPPVTLNGTIQPEWDPYADPSLQSPGMLPPSGYMYGQPPPGQADIYAPPQQFAQPGLMGQPMEAWQGAQRALEQIKFEYAYLGGDGGDDFSINDLELNATFNIPFSYNVAPLLVTPGFAVHYWDGPDFPAPDLPPRVYDAYLELGWRPQITPWFSADLGVRTGIYTDFEDVDSDSFRFPSRGLAIFTTSPQTQLVVGVVYLDRNEVKLLPAVGLIWTPNEDTRYEIFFPRPKFSQRVTTIGNTDWWVFIAGEYGGGNWSIERDAGFRDSVDYNDLRISVGAEWMNFNGLKGSFEAGYVFDRELVFTSGTPKFEPDDTFMLRAGVSY